MTRRDVEARIAEGRGLRLVEKSPRCLWCGAVADVYHSDRSIHDRRQGFMYAVQEFHVPDVWYTPGPVAFCPRCANEFGSEW